VHFRPVIFEPTFHKHAREACGGCQVHVTDRQAFLPVLASVAIMAAFHRANPGRFAWRQPPYEYEHDKMPIDILAGSPALRERIEGGTGAREIAATWDASVAAFDAARRACLLY
jgi:uncharacterized protein YbbC (DUF1343 family)